MRELLEVALSTQGVEIFGFYSHFGRKSTFTTELTPESYASCSPEEAAEYLAGEVACVSSAAQIALDLGAKPSNPYILSVGATPTAHAVESLKSAGGPGIVEM
jgi:hypothetical protein